MKMLLKLITAITMIVGMLLAAPAAANATEPNWEDCQTTGSASNSEVTLEACAYSKVSDKVNVKEVVRTDAEGNVVLSHYANPKPWSLKRAKKCNAIYVDIDWSKKRINRKVNRNKSEVNNKFCVLLKHGSTWANSGRQGHIEVPFTATVRGNFSLMVYNQKQKVWEHFGELKDGQFIQVCKNDWKIGVHPELTDEDVVMVESEAMVTYRLETELSATSGVRVKGSLTCPTGTLYGEAEASSTATNTVFIFVKAASAAEAEGQGSSAEVHTEAFAKLHVQLTQDIETMAHAKVTLECSENPPTYDQCPNIPGDQPEGYECYPPVNPPTYAQFRQINDVYVNATTDHCVTVDFPEGHGGSVFWTANKGSFAITTKTAQDMVQVCASYKAPSEVPASGTDTITVTATDNVTGKSVFKTTDPFTIKAMPATP